MKESSGLKEIYNPLEGGERLSFWAPKSHVNWGAEQHHRLSFVASLTALAPCEPPLVQKHSPLLDPDIHLGWWVFNCQSHNSERTSHAALSSALNNDGSSEAEGDLMLWFCLLSWLSAPVLPKLQSQGTIWACASLLELIRKLNRHACDMGASSPYTTGLIPGLGSVWTTHSI